MIYVWYNEINASNTTIPEKKNQGKKLNPKITNLKFRNKKGQYCSTVRQHRKKDKRSLSWISHLLIYTLSTLAAQRKTHIC